MVMYFRDEDWKTKILELPQYPKDLDTCRTERPAPIHIEPSVEFDLVAGSTFEFFRLYAPRRRPISAVHVGRSRRVAPGHPRIFRSHLKILGISQRLPEADQDIPRNDRVGWKPLTCSARRTIASSRLGIAAAEFDGRIAGGPACPRTSESDPAKRRQHARDSDCRHNGLLPRRLPQDSATDWLQRRAYWTDPRRFRDETFGLSLNCPFPDLGSGSDRTFTLHRADEIIAYKDVRIDQVPGDRGQKLGAGRVANR
jgi:hypothetical protein